MSRRPCRSYFVKVKGRGSGEIITTYALLDNGSTSTWCRESLAKRLGVVGPRIEVSLSTIEKDCNPTSCHRVCLEIMDMDEINMIELPQVLTKEKLNISTDGVACQDDANRWSHLSGIQVPERINADSKWSCWLVKMFLRRSSPPKSGPVVVMGRTLRKPSLVGL